LSPTGRRPDAPADPARLRKLLVMELAGLGDNVQLLPALWGLRQSLPKAELHVMVSAHAAELFRMTPWVDRVWAYPRLPRRPGLIGNLRWLRDLRRQHFDLVFNTTGSDRSALLAGLSGARLRYGRRPPSGGRFWWPWMFTRIVEHPFRTEAMIRQKLAVFAAAGFPADDVRFQVSIDVEARRRHGIAARDDRHYLHLSPCAGEPMRELPIAQLAQICRELWATRPDLKLVVSCADLPRERERVDELLGQLGERPWKVFVGATSIPELTSILQGAALHLGGDSGSLNLAVMVGTPAVAWFRELIHVVEGMPTGPNYRVLRAPDTPQRDALHGIDTNAVVAAARELLR
jgi:ADP-heptose:LPS heptosyltransferase